MSYFTRDVSARIGPHPTRRNFLSQAAGVAAGGTALALATISATADAAAPVASLPSSGVDPVFDAIERYRKARHALREAEAAHSLTEKEMHADGSLFPSTVSIGNPYSSVGRPVSRSHADIDRYSPADMFPQDNAREHEQLSAAISLRDARIGPIEEAMNDAAIAEQIIVEELVDTEPTTIGGVLALLRWQRDYSEGSDFLEGYLASFLMESIETGLLNLQAGGGNHELA
jgi:hypothetical protein